MTLLTAVAALSLQALLDGPTGSVAVKCRPDAAGLSCELSWLTLVVMASPLPEVPQDAAALEALCQASAGKLGTDEQLAELCRKPPAARATWLRERELTCMATTRDMTVRFAPDGEGEGGKRWRSTNWSGVWLLVTKAEGKVVRLEADDGSLWSPAQSQLHSFPQQCSRVVLFNKDH